MSLHLQLVTGTNFVRQRCISLEEVTWTHQNEEDLVNKSKVKHKHQLSNVPNPGITFIDS